MAELRIMKNVMAPMRDGVLLACDIYRPDDSGKYPAILMRTPYIKERFAGEWLYSNYRELALAGYNVVIQDVRGTGKSGGELLSNGGNEVDDGYDTVEWVAAQSWCDGNVGMYGLSYFGFTQMAAAQDNPPHLRTLCPFQNGSLTPLSITKAMTVGHYHLMWLYGRVEDRLEALGVPEEEKAPILQQMAYNRAHWAELTSRLPLRETEAAKIDGVPLLHDFVDLVDGVEDDAYWKQARRPIRLNNIANPMFHLTGWFDGACSGTFDNYNEIAAHGTETAKRASRLVVGPWGHGGSLSSTIDGVDFGAENSGAARGVQEMIKSWFDRWLKHDMTAEYPPITLFVLGKNIWRDEQEWPLARTQYTNYYIHGGQERKCGLMSTDLPGAETPQRYTYDPENPQPSSYKDANGRSALADPAAMEHREDVLVYRTEAFLTDTEVTGPVKFVLHAATTAVDTDFFAKLSDVDETGRALPLLKGIVRARFRHGRIPEPVEPGRVFEYTIDLGNISNVFLPGHRIRLDLSSSSYPEHDRNLNTGERIGHGKNMVKAVQTIFHDEQYPSHLVLPVISLSEKEG